AVAEEVLEIDAGDVGIVLELARAKPGGAPADEAFGPRGGRPEDDPPGDGQLPPAPEPIRRPAEPRVGVAGPPGDHGGVDGDERQDRGESDEQPLGAEPFEPAATDAEPGEVVADAE